MGYKDGHLSKNGHLNGRRLMPGENPASEFAEDADHWISVYEELISYEAGALAQLESRLDFADGRLPGRAKVDVNRLATHLADLRKGVEYWRQRRTELV